MGSNRSTGKEVLHLHERDVCFICRAAHWCCHHAEHTASSASALAASAALPPSSLSQMSEHRAEEQGTLTVSLSPLAEQSPVTS